MTERHGAGELACRVRRGGCGNVQSTRAATRRVLTQSLVTACAVDLEGHQVGRPFFLETGGFDVRQARTRRQIDVLQRKGDRLEAVLSTLPEGDERQQPLRLRLAVYQREITRGWRKYHARNRDLAHLASNVPPGRLKPPEPLGLKPVPKDTLRTQTSTSLDRKIPI